MHVYQAKLVKEINKKNKQNERERVSETNNDE